MFPERMLCPKCRNANAKHCASPTCNWYPCRRPKCQLTLVAVKRIEDGSGWYGRTKTTLPSQSPPE